MLSGGGAAAITGGVNYGIMYPSALMALTFTFYLKDEDCSFVL